MKLKTIRDIEGITLSPREKQVENYLKEQIKIEAIKWVRFLNKLSPEDQYIIMWIEHFFNLTESDLEEQDA